jgi:hypothetical protein
VHIHERHQLIAHEALSNISINWSYLVIKKYNRCDQMNICTSLSNKLITQEFSNCATLIMKVAILDKSDTLPIWIEL